MRQAPQDQDHGTERAWCAPWDHCTTGSHGYGSSWVRARRRAGGRPPHGASCCYQVTCTGAGRWEIFRAAVAGSVTWRPWCHPGPGRALASPCSLRGTASRCPLREKPHPSHISIIAHYFDNSACRAFRAGEMSWLRDSVELRNRDLPRMRREGPGPATGFRDLWEGGDPA